MEVWSIYSTFIKAGKTSNRKDETTNIVNFVSKIKTTSGPINKTWILRFEFH